MVNLLALRVLKLSKKSYERESKLKLWSNLGHWRSGFAKLERESHSPANRLGLARLELGMACPASGRFPMAP
jgi:hypothetical protein